MNKEQQVKEIIHCGKDPVYFIKTYTKIHHSVKGIIPFETYPFQDDCVREFEKHRFNIVLKSRQLGLSTICAGYATWFALFHKAKNILIIANKLETAVNFLKKVKAILQSVPPWMLLTKYEMNMRSIRFSNGSVITAIPTSDDAGRSEALSLLIVDEAAIIRNFEEVWTGLYPTISTGGRVIVLSTPKGVGGQYYKLWADAEAGLNDFNPIKLPWFVHPEHDEVWFTKETRGLKEKDIAQEFLCDFISSGETFLQAPELEYLHSSIEPPIEKTGDDRNVWVWHQPIPGAKYVMSADVARGDSTDCSTFHIIESETCTVAAEYKGKVPPDKFADLINVFGRKYNNALVCPENNTFGYTTAIRLRDLNYPRLYYASARGNIYDYKPLNQDEVPGFSTQAKSRIQILSKLEELVRNKILKSRSQRLYSEMQTFIWSGSKAQARKDSNDDLIMSLSIGVWLLDVVFGTGSVDNDLHKTLISAMSVSSRTAPLPTGPRNPADINPIFRGASSENVLKPVDEKTARRYMPGIDLTGWLIK
jgi:hypothetical protein